MNKQGTAAGYAVDVNVTTPVRMMGIMTKELPHEATTTNPERTNSAFSCNISATSGFRLLLPPLASRR